MRFFFYGTLGEGMDNPTISAIRPRLGPARAASVRAVLHAIPDRNGWYPALTLDPAGPRIHGVLHDTAAEFTADDLRKLDAYEAFDPEDHAASQYVRQTITVECGGEPVEADAYLYNATLPPGARLIGQSSFNAFLAENGYRALAPRDP